MSQPPALIIHGLPDLLAATAPGLPVTLLSGPGAALYAGPAWWAALLRAGNYSGPSLLDCAAAPGRALEALSLGVPGLVLAPCPAWGQIARLAEAQGARLLARHRLTAWLMAKI